jgi:hypothetical protein
MASVGVRVEPTVRNRHRIFGGKVIGDLEFFNGRQHFNVDVAITVCGFYYWIFLF